MRRLILVRVVKGLAACSAILSFCVGCLPANYWSDMAADAATTFTGAVVSSMIGAVLRGLGLQGG